MTRVRVKGFKLWKDKKTTIDASQLLRPLIKELDHSESDDD